MTAIHSCNKCGLALGLGQALLYRLCEQRRETQANTKPSSWDLHPNQELQ